MGLDKLGILFIIIILPISLVLNAYTNTQVDTLNMQISYDTKLNNSTYDALKTYQINSLSEDYSNLGDVRIGNINAAINVFFTSLASNLNMSGYSRQFLQEYVPAIVFTMYDGYYIYSKYTNTLGAEEIGDGTYKNGEQLYGLKPFVHYSCRYKYGTNYDFVVSYTLDNYVTIQGIVDGKAVDKSGYLIDKRKYSDFSYSNGEVTSFKYRNVEIKKNEPILTDNLILETNDGTSPQTKAYKYHKVNGVKYYYDNSTGCWFSMANGIDNDSGRPFDVNYDDSAYNYYKKAYEFSAWVESNLSSIITSDMSTIDYNFSKNNTEQAASKTNTAKNGIKIFNLSGIEEPTSNFNQHRREVIRYTIEKNLSIAIANYNNYSGTPGFEFRMPEFSEEEWDRIQDNMTVIAYLQGLPIGTKIYNGVSVVANNVNEEVVSEQSIYIGIGGNTTDSTATGNNYYPITYKINSSSSIPSAVGIYNVDLQRREVEYNNQKYYYYPKLYFNVYNSARDTVNINAEKTNEFQNEYAYNGNIYTYIDNVLVGTSPNTDSSGYKIAKAFYTALGRERESRYNQRNNYENLLEELDLQDYELYSFNRNFEQFEGEISGDQVRELIDAANATNKANPSDLSKRVVVRYGGGPSKAEYFKYGDSSDSNGRDLSDAGRDDLNYWNTDNTYHGDRGIGNENLVVANIGTGHIDQGYLGDVSIGDGDLNTIYKVKCYYYTGTDDKRRVKAVYVYPK